MAFGGHWRSLALTLSLSLRPPPPRLRQAYLLRKPRAARDLVFVEIHLRTARWLGRCARGCEGEPSLAAERHPW